MNPEDRELLERVMRLTEQNNQILRKMRRSMLWGTIATVLYWLVILGVVAGAYYFIQPYLGALNTLVQKLVKLGELPASLPKF
jgi:hypothetical protein